MPAPVFSAAIDVLFADPNLATDAIYRAGGADPGVPVRVIVRRPDRVGEFGETRIVAWRGLLQDRPEHRRRGLRVVEGARYRPALRRGLGHPLQAGLFLAIPTPAAGRFGDGRQKITPGSWERIHGLRLRFVYRRGSPSLLVADNARLTGRGRAVANTGRLQGAAFTRLAGRTMVPLFLLVPQMTVRKRLDVDGAARKWVAAVPQLVLQHWQISA